MAVTMTLTCVVCTQPLWVDGPSATWVQLQDGSAHVDCAGYVTEEDR